MRIKSAVAPWFKSGVLVIIGIMITAVLFLTLTTHFTLYEFLSGCAAVLIAAAFLLWLLFGTFYEFRGDYLYCRSGPFSEKIRYDCITYLGLSENMLSSMALSSQMIEIRQYNKSYVTGTTMISPENREIFLAQLKSLCSRLDPSEQ